MSIIDYFTTCDKPFNPGYEWELAAAPTGMAGFEWLDAAEVNVGWAAGACRDWNTRMWAVKRNGLIAYSGALFRHPTTGEVFWTYYGAPEGAKVADPSAEPFVAIAQAAGFVFVGLAKKTEPEPGPDGPWLNHKTCADGSKVEWMSDQPEPACPPVPGKARFPWLLAGLGLGAIVTVIVAKTRKTKRKTGYERKG